MKIKVKDLTVTQIYEYCKEQESCRTCPFGHYHWYHCWLNMPYSLEEETLEQEVEITEEEVNA